jgi:magnesium chelatase family protein
MLVKTYGSAVFGIQATIVTIEVNISSGGINFYMVGLPDNAVKESQQRIRAAFKNLEMKHPERRICL